jgi:hypothetical protein
MQPEHLRFGGGASETVLHPAVLVAMILAVVLILTLPRRKVITPFLLIAILSPTGQQIYLGGLHWLVLRIIIITGCLRLFIDYSRNRNGLFAGGFNRIDQAFIICALFLAVSPILLFQTSSAIPFQLASLLQSIGGYFFLRHLIQDERDIKRLALTLAPATLILGICMGIERFDNINVFGYARSLSISPIIRDNLVRAQASFSHPILAGCFGATTVPLFYWLGRLNGHKVMASLGIAGSVLMVFFSASSTPAMALLGGLGVLALWPIRRSMRQLRWGIVLSLFVLQIVMKAPVWFLIARVQVTGASDAYDRAMLIDIFFRHFSSWWLIGADPAKWGNDMWDLCNQFVGVGETGGLGAFVFFIALFVRSFSKLGKTRKRVAGVDKLEWLQWSIGAVMFVHILSYFGVSYYDQTAIWWYASLAMVSAAATVSRPVMRRNVHVVTEARLLGQPQPIAAMLHGDAPGTHAFDVR